MNAKIQQAAKLCREAFAANPNATWVWCCHHEILYERLTETPENRIKYILDNKDTKEQETRLNNFRPVLDDESKLAPLYADYESKLAPLDADVVALYRQEVPLGTWNGKSIFN